MEWKAGLHSAAWPNEIPGINMPPGTKIRLALQVFKKYIIDWSYVKSWTFNFGLKFFSEIKKVLLKVGGFFMQNEAKRT